MPRERVAIIGAQAAPVGRYARASKGAAPIPEADLLVRCAVDALGEAGVAAADVGTAVFTTVSPETRQLGFSIHVASRLGLKCRGQIAEVMSMGLTGGLAFDQAAADIALGRADIALALGAAYSSGGDPAQAMLQGIRVVGDAEFQAPFGATPIAWYGMDMMRYLDQTGASRADVAAVAVKSRRAARGNPLAQFTDPLTLADVLNARPDRRTAAASTRYRPSPTVQSAWCSPANRPRAISARRSSPWPGADSPMTVITRSA